MTRRTVAVIGSGVAGLTAAHVLQRSHDVTLYEADQRPGGHADTHDVPRPNGETLAVDTAFLVHNERTYPTLLRLFAELGVATRDTDMSMSISCEGCGLEYSGGQGANGILAQRTALLRPRFVRMLGEIKRFHREARVLLAAPEDEAQETLADFLARGRFSPYFVHHFVTPLVAAVWSCGPATAGAYPARYLFTFLDHHGMLSVKGSPTWRTVSGGSRTYVEKVVKNVSAVHLETPVSAVTRNDGVIVQDAGGREARFDSVVIATHPDQALGMLVDPTPAEVEVLGAFAYSRNPTVLHTDPVVLPRNRRAQASWNYRMDSCTDDADSVRVSYDVSRLQGLEADERYVVSLNLAPGDVDPARVVDSMVYAHPLYTPASVAAQKRLPELNDGTTAYAGAYHGWGFHEDGARAGLAAAVSLGGSW